MRRSTLPDRSRLVYERNGQNQVVALKRQAIQTPWLRWGWVSTVSYRDGISR